jgi:hypothetical protein
MNGFIKVVSDLLHTNGVPQAHVLTSSRMELPGWFRAEKKWDLLVIADGKLLAGVEYVWMIDDVIDLVAASLRSLLKLVEGWCFHISKFIYICAQPAQLRKFRPIF